jgi:hypothetical protein
LPATLELRLDRLDPALTPELGGHPGCERLEGSTTRPDRESSARIDRRRGMTAFTPLDLRACVRPANTPVSACSPWKPWPAMRRTGRHGFHLPVRPARDLFSIGFNVTERRCDASFYDLLASEARLCSYVAIALGQVPQDHWFSLGRLLVASRGEPMLVSWSGSMFEYLMPLLVMPNYEHTLLDHTCKAAVQHRSSMGKCAACRGAFPNRATTGPTFT